MIPDAGAADGDGKVMIPGTTGAYLDNTPYNFNKWNNAV